MKMSTHLIVVENFGLKTKKRRRKGVFFNKIMGFI